LEISVQLIGVGGVFAKIGPIPNAIMEPIKIPAVIVVPMKEPTWLRCDPSGTHYGALTAHSVATKPLVSEKSMMFTILNQSELNSQEGPTWKATRRKVANQITLEAEILMIILFAQLNLGEPPALRPIVSQMLKILLLSKKNQETSLLMPVMKL
jgi:hypothetical protein